MSYARILKLKRCGGCIGRLAVATAVLLFASTGAAQTTAAQPEMPWSQDMKKYPGLTTEFGRLMTRLQHEVQVPPARSQSRLLPLLPRTTVFYAALPNYGDAAHQVLAIFREELQQSSDLRDWWRHGELATIGPKIEDSLDKFYQLSQYLGDEVVVSGSTEGGKDPNFLMLVEVRKPGLKVFLQQMVKELAGNSKPPVRVLDMQELATAKDSDTGAGQELVVLVRPDYVVVAPNVAALRGFNARLDRSDRQFVATAFGERLQQEYQGGAEVLAAADLQTILKQIPSGHDQSQMAFQRSGFADMKYLVWNHKGVPGQAASQAELSFTGPRHGVASWLTSPAPMGSLDFVSPKAILASSVLLKNLGVIFDDVKDLATASNPNAFAMIEQMEQGMNLSLKDDLLSLLTGEITLELDNAAPPDPVWRAILRVKDPVRLQKTFSKLLAMAPVTAAQSEEQGITYHSLKIPAPQKTLEISYAFVDGYLVIASSHETAAEAVRLHRTGESLAKSKKFLESLPPGHSSGASALLYEDPVAMMALRLRMASPQMAESLSQATTETTPAVICAYGEDSAIREASTRGGVDAGMVLVVAAIAIPNLLRAKTAANDSSAVGMMRTIDTAQVTYSVTYPDRGYARDLATLGPGPGGTGTESADHAGFIDATLGNASCTVGTWCAKSGFRFRIRAVCLQQKCAEFVVVATPAVSNAGSRNFCSTSDGVVRFKVGSPLTLPVSVQECRRWPPLQ
jgi:hypothetical protein